MEAHPNTRIARLELTDDTLRVWVRARAIQGQANSAIEQAIAEALGLRHRQVRIVSGATSRRKTVEIDVGSMEEFRERLTASNRT